MTQRLRSKRRTNLVVVSSSSAEKRTVTSARPQTRCWLATFVGSIGSLKLSRNSTLDTRRLVDGKVEPQGRSSELYPANFFHRTFSLARIRFARFARFDSIRFDCLASGRANVSLQQRVNMSIKNRAAKFECNLPPAIDHLRSVLEHTDHSAR